MRLVVALGNPGPQYELSRHNYAWLVADRLLELVTIRSRKETPSYRALAAAHSGVGFALCWPLSYMNRSGIAVDNALRELRADIEQMIVLHDDLDIPFGTFRLKVGGGHGGHKGLVSILRETGRADFIRLRLGIGVLPRPVDAASYVLEPFGPAQMPVVEKLLGEAALAVVDLLHSEPAVVMNRVNRLAREAAELDDGTG